MCVVYDLVNIGELPWKAFGRMVVGGSLWGKECDGVECSKWLGV